MSITPSTDRSPRKASMSCLLTADVDVGWIRGSRNHATRLRSIRPSKELRESWRRLLLRHLQHRHFLPLSNSTLIELSESLLKTSCRSHIFRVYRDHLKDLIFFCSFWAFRSFIPPLHPCPTAECHHILMSHLLPSLSVYFSCTMHPCHLPSETLHNWEHPRLMGNPCLVM